MKSSLIAGFGALAVAFAAVPASATILIYVDQPGVLQPEENVLFNVAGFGGTGNPIFGVTNQSSTSVTFEGNETLTAPAAGQARVEAADGTLNYLKFSLSDPTLGFKEVEFNLQRIVGGPFQPFDIVVDFSDNFGNIFSTTSQIGTGANWFSAQALDNQWIMSITLDTAPNNIADIRQLRLGGIGTVPTGAIPEPATWAMLIAGFGMVGGAMRRRRGTVATTTA